MGRHIPGKPTVTVQVMPGAGGIRAANYLAEQAPRDGTAITTFANGPILEPLIGARNPGYDMSSFTWIGAITKDIGLCISWGPTPFKTIDDVKTQQMIVAGTGAGSETDTWPIVLKDRLRGPSSSWERSHFALGTAKSAGLSAMYVVTYRILRFPCVSRRQCAYRVHSEPVVADTDTERT
jgi:hypothetical protein